MNIRIDRDGPFVGIGGLGIGLTSIAAALAVIFCVIL
jgi:hypothetical protein